MPVINAFFVNGYSPNKIVGRSSKPAACRAYQAAWTRPAERVIDPAAEFIPPAITVESG
jgi:hypothetical protein